MSITLDRLRAAQRWGRPSGARRTAGGGRRLSNAPVRVETCEIRNQSAPEVAQRYEALVGPVKARGDGRRARTDADSLSRQPRAPQHSSSTQSLPPFLNFDQ